MTSFHLLPAPRPYQPPACVRHLVQRLRRENWLQNATRSSAVPTRDPDTGLDWDSISGNVVATIIAGLALSALGLLGYVAYQVPRQQELILQNQGIAREKLADIANEIRELETNDRKQDERLTKIESSR